MDFPIFHLDMLGNRMLIAIIATVHVLINHAMAVGFIPVIALMEYLGFRDRHINPEKAKKWDELAQKMLRVGFIITTSLGALTGVGIWFSASLLNPTAIGSLIRVFYGAWFTEWIVFVLEVIFIMMYYMWWKKSNNSEKSKRNHIIFGAVLSLFSWLTMLIIVAILGFMMDPGNWLTQHSFLRGVANPIYIPQLYFRTPLSMMLGGSFALLLAMIFTKKGDEIREKVISFLSLWLLIWAPVMMAGGLLYRAAIPNAMAGNIPTGLTTMAFVQWYNSILWILLGTFIITLLTALWGILKPRKLPRAFLIIPIIALFIITGSFERVREFIRKPFVIGEYLYANGLRVADYPIYQKDGILKHSAYTSTPNVTPENKLEAGKNVFMITCSRCHTITGINSVVTNFQKMMPPGQPLNADVMKQYIPGMHTVRYYMPPFPGNAQELDALVAFIVDMSKNPRYIEGDQDKGTVVSPLTSHNGIPAPRDIPLKLPLSRWILIALLILSFLLHILFVNLMLGGSVITLIAEIKGLKNKAFNVLAREITNTITVNKSLAVVLGVAPLLSINVVYTIFFYTGNSLTGNMWISLVPIISIAFLLLYYHKYTWDKYPGKIKSHIGILVAAVIMLLFVPFVFLSNINLMLFPEKWGVVKGFFSAMMLANVIPRYFHFVVASFAITGLFLFKYMNRSNYPFENRFQSTSIEKNRLLKLFLKITFHATLLQLIFGTLNFLTLPWNAVKMNIVYIFGTGIAFAVIAMILLWKEIKGPEEEMGKRFYAIVIIFSITVLCMGMGRHTYRANALKPHIEDMKKQTLVTPPVTINK